MRESEGKRKEVGTTERFPSILLMRKNNFFTVSGQGAFIANPKYKLPKTTKLNAIIRRKKKENQKSQKSKTGSRKSRMNSGKMVNSGSCRKAISQPCKIFVVLNFLCILCSSFLLVSDLQC